RQTQNPERGRKLHIDFLDLARREDHVVRPKTPREDGNSSTIASMSMSQSSSRQTQNPERGRKHFDDNSLTTNFQSRQTQNPERGRKQCWRRFSLLWFSLSSDPKPREGTETHPTRYRWRASFIESSDPKPREGTETMLATIFAVVVLIVVRPKTPRGDGNNAGDDFRCCGSHCRQTQNPERGRKLAGSGLRVLTSPVVVRPKTPRGDGNA
ncbi:hypothetical protein AP17_04040, partial [Mycobacterium tuberculosis M2435]